MADRGRTRTRRRRGRSRDSRGAALVEFALVATPLFAILFGTIEFGWAFFQLNDIRHGAREGIRLAVVDSDVVPSDTTWTTEGERIAQATCERMDRKDGVQIIIKLVDLNGDTFLETGDEVQIIARKPLEQLTQMFSPVLSHVDLDETIASRLEQNPSYGNTNWYCE